MKVRALLAVLAVFVSGGLGASAAPGGSSPRTLLATRGTIVSFARDGSELAWVETAGRNRKCRRTLHLSGRKRAARRGGTTVRFGCGIYRDLALAGGRVLRLSLAELGKTHVDVNVMTLAAGQRRSRRLEFVHVDFDPRACYDLTLVCAPERPPVLAGAAGVLAYATPTGIRTVVGGTRKRLFALRAPRALAVAGGRVLAVGSELRPGDGCGCASAPAWLPDGSVEYLGHVGPQSNLSGELVHVSADGSDRHLVTHDGRFRLSLDVAADGTKIAYGYVNLADSTRLVAVAAPDGSGAHDVGPGEQPTWSPDGSRLAVVRGTAGTRQIYVMDADGGNVRQLTQGSESAQPAWSPDGSRIAYSSQGIRVVGADGSDPRALGLDGSEPDWSPDGTHLVFSGRQGGIWVAAADGSGARLVTAAGGETPRWSPDGRSIVFQGGEHWWDVSDRYELYVVNADGSDLRPLTFTVPAGWVSTAEVHLAGGRLLLRFELPGEVYDAALGGDTAALAQSSPSGGVVVTLFDVPTGTRQGSLTLTTKFAPDLVGVTGRWLVFDAGRLIGGVDLRTGTRETFATAASWPVGVSLTGRTVTWAENVAGHGRLRALTLPRSSTVSARRFQHG